MSWNLKQSFGQAKSIQLKDFIKQLLWHRQPVCLTVSDCHCLMLWFHKVQSPPSAPLHPIKESPWSCLEMTSVVPTSGVLLIEVRYPTTCRLVFPMTHQAQDINKGKLKRRQKPCMQIFDKSFSVLDDSENQDTNNQQQRQGYCRL